MTSETKGRKRWLAILALALVCAGAIFLSIDMAPAPPPIVVLPSSYVIPKSPGPWPDRWIPRKAGWLWRIRYALFGRAKTVGLDNRYFRDTGSIESIAAKFSLGPPQTQSNGVSVWLLPESRFASLSTSTNHIGSMRVSTGDLMQSAGFVIEPHARSFAAYSLPRLKESGLDMIVDYVAGSTPTNGSAGGMLAQTNYAAAVRAQIPWNTALFLLDARNPDSNAERFGVLLVTGEYDAKGNKITH